MTVKLQRIVDKIIRYLTEYLSQTHFIYRVRAATKKQKKTKKKKSQNI